MALPSVPVGFDYAKALLEIRKKRTYEQIAEYCGYETPSAISRVLTGSVPSHPQGEAIWALHCELFGQKPPVSHEQATGQYIAFSEQGKHHI